jgi:hypothetical protein
MTDIFFYRQFVIATQNYFLANKRFLIQLKVIEHFFVIPAIVYAFWAIYSSKYVDAIFDLELLMAALDCNLIGKHCGTML